MVALSHGQWPGHRCVLERALFFYAVSEIRVCRRIIVCIFFCVDSIGWADAINQNDLNIHTITKRDANNVKAEDAQSTSCSK